MIAEGEHVPDVNTVQVNKLAAWGFVTFHPDQPDKPVALEPEEASRRQVRAMVEEAEQRVAHLKALPDLTEQLSDLYQRGQWRAGGGSEFISDAVVVNARLDDVIAGAQWEILAAQPGGPRTRELLERSLTRDTGALERGIALKTLYRDTVRDHAVTAEGARIMSARGAAYRTLVAPGERCIVVDRKIAVISNHVVEGAPAHAAWLVTDRAMVAFIAVVFDEAWNRASPWHGELRTRGTADVDTVSGPAAGVRTNPLQRAVLRHMADGIQQHVTAARLGISLRKLTDEIAKLKVQWGVQTLPELTYRWALSPDRLVDDGPAAAAVESIQGVAAKSAA